MVKQELFAAKSEAVNFCLILRTAKVLEKEEQAKNSGWEGRSEICANTCMCLCVCVCTDQ